MMSETKPSPETTLPLREGEKALHLGISSVLPGVEDSADGCIQRFAERMKAQTGISEAHLEDHEGQPVLCLHYDPNLVPLERVERIARDTGVEITTRFRHEMLPLTGMDHGTNPANIERAVRALPGVLTATVNYPIQRIRLEYDSTQTSHEAVVQVIRSLGFKVGEQGHDHDHEHEGHEHDDEGHEAHGGHEGNPSTPSPSSPPPSKPTLPSRPSPSPQPSSPATA